MPESATPSLKQRAAGGAFEDAAARTAAHACLIALFLVAVLRSAWMSDDAYITLRTVDNFVSGYGLRWNVVERVQTFTHPLWMLLLTVPYYATREAYLTSLVVSIVTSAAAVWILMRRLAMSTAVACLAALLLTFSKAFVEYSTSGLENPLTYLLAAMFLLAYWDRRRLERPTRVWLAAAALMLTRLDTALIVAPALMVFAVSVPWRRSVRAAALGLSPLVVWELFSLTYYGFLFPNTAYAKLATGVASGELIAQGLLYLLDSVSRDPLTPMALCACAIAAVAARPRESWPIAAGLLLYVLYIVRIGGDFMSGRFLALPLFVAVALASRQRWPRLHGWAPAAAMTIALVGLFATTRPPILTTPETFATEPRDIYGVGGVDDERAFYSRYTGLLRTSRQQPLPHNAGIEAGRAARGTPQVLIMGSIGLFAYYAGPSMHIVDPAGLADPLLARLPSEGRWRPGHFERAVPDGYVETLQGGRNVFANPAIGMQYERLRLITQGPIWSGRRWRAILAANID